MTTAERNANFPNVPTAIESGVAGYDFASWGGVFAPAATPREIVMKLNAEIGTALASPELTKRFDGMGLVAKAGTPEGFGRFLVDEINRWKKVLGAKP